MRQFTEKTQNNPGMNTLKSIEISNISVDLIVIFAKAKIQQGTNSCFKPTEIPPARKCHISSLMANFSLPPKNNQHVRHRTDHSGFNTYSESR